MSDVLEELTEAEEQVEYRILIEATNHYVERISNEVRRVVNCNSPDSVKLMYLQTLSDKIIYLQECNEWLLSTLSFKKK